MSNNIKGITVEIGGNTGPLSSAMKEVNKTAGDLQSELREVNKQLKFDPQNTTLLTQKMDLLKQSAQTLEEKQKTLKTAVEQAHAAFEKGELGADKVRAVEREYEKVNSQLKETKKDLAAAEAESGNFAEKVKGKFSQLKDKIKDTFSPANIKAGIGAIGVAVGGFLKGSLDEAKDAEKANADLEQTLKSTKGAAGMTMQSLEELSGAMVKNTTFSDDEAKSGQAMLLTFTNIGKDVFPQATAALLDMSQKMGTDTKTQAMQLGKALNDPVKGITALTRVGVTFTDQQKKQIAAMEKVGNTAGAQKIILAELNKEFGGQAAAAAETYDGKQKQVANTMKEIKETIGTALMPVLANLLKSVTPIIQAAANFVSKNPQLTAGILSVIAIIGTLIGGMQLLTTVTTFFGLAADASLAPILPVVLGITAAVIGLSALAAVVVTHWSQISTFFINLWNTIKGAFSGIGTWFTSAFMTAANGVKSSFAAIPAWWNNLWTQIGQFFTNLWNGIIAFFTQTIPQWISSFIDLINKLPYYIGYAIGMMIADIINFGVDAWNWVTTKLPQIINGIIQWFQQLPGKIWDFLADVVTKIGQWISDMAAKVAAGIPVIISNVATFFSQLPGKIWTFLTDIISKVVQWCANLNSTAKTEIPKFISSVVSFIAELPGKMLDIGKNIVTGIWNGITGAVSWLHDKITGFCQGIVDGIKDNLKIHSPSQVLADEVGKFMALGIGQGFTDSMKSVTSAMAEAIPTNFDSSVQVRTAIAAAGGYSTTSTSAGASSKAYGAQTSSESSASQPISLTLVTPDGQMLGKFVAPFVGKELEFNSKTLLPSRG